MGGKDTLRRMGFKRTNTSEDPVTATTTELNDFNDGEPSSSKLGAEYAGDVKHDHSETVRNLSEVEANRRLRMFRADHKFDPNLPDSAEGAIEDAVRSHSLKDEAALVDELVEDSPYPEVRWLPNCKEPKLTALPGPCSGSQLRSRGADQHDSRLGHWLDSHYHLLGCQRVVHLALPSHSDWAIRRTADRLPSWRGLGKAYAES